MKKIILLLLVLLLLGAAIVGWIFLGPATGFSERKQVLYISSHAATKRAVIDSLQQRAIVKNTSFFTLLADQLDYWKNIKPGKYEVPKGTSLLSLVRMLRNGRQTPVNLVITKLRTRADLARLAGSRFEFDSAVMLQFLITPDSLRSFSIDPATSMALVLPDTYTFFWNTTPHKVYQKLAEESAKFWTAERKAKAGRLGLTPVQAYTLASIVEEETNAQAEKGNIASVYLNRVKTGMPLQADPTIRFALNDFSIKRVYGAHLDVESPYNTYRNNGLPPGPICTPSRKTIDAVLNAPETPYLYFVADSSFNGTHVFSTTYDEHLKKAKAYQEAFRQRFAPKQQASGNGQ
ncbi:endolytic transglycosylase MltG [Paraflavisolibacter sp. H34]|uniref:endolytic transglycosylase MltG n=1 Tax=Huijunlia imazamoxiresistens TaxID=3127457 RepID=UPI00301B2D0F